MRRAILIAAGMTWFACCGGQTPAGPTPSPAASTMTLAGMAPEAVLVGAGDIALCSALAPAEATAKLLDGVSGTVFTAGDNVQAEGTDEEYRNCFAPTWGRHRGRIRPSPGNHDYQIAGGAPYFTYFASSTGSPNQPYYSYDLGTWHIVSLNSNLPAGPGSPQAAWLANDLSESQAACTLAYWHEPLFSSGPNGPNPAVQELWQLLYLYDVDVVVNGHDHVYERFGPQNPSGRPDTSRGIRQFIVGTGGAPLYSFARVAPNSEARASVHGVLKLTLQALAYSWDFLPAAGQSFRDSGVGTCH